MCTIVYDRNRRVNKRFQDSGTLYLVSVQFAQYRVLCSDICVIEGNRSHG